MLLSEVNSMFKKIALLFLALLLIGSNVYANENELASSDSVTKCIGEDCFVKILEQND